MEARFPRQLVRVVKETDSKSVGQCPRKFESCSCRFYSNNGYLFFYSDLVYLVCIIIGMKSNSQI